MVVTTRPGINWAREIVLGLVTGGMWWIFVTPWKVISRWSTR